MRPLICLTRTRLHMLLRPTMERDLAPLRLGVTNTDSLGCLAWIIVDS